MIGGIKETSYGVVKRLGFIADVIECMLDRQSAMEPLKILDFGCGTGQLLSIPLAQSFENRIVLYAYDIDLPSLEKLTYESRNKNIRNIVVCKSRDEIVSQQFDIIIFSEVIEHIENPQKILSELIEMLKADGKLIITLPNGYGYFEFDSLMTNIIILLIKPILYKLLSRKRKNANDECREQATLAINPHINFFSYRQIIKLLSSLNLTVEKCEGRTFICGPIISKLIDKSDFLIALNNYLGSKLPLFLVSGWMMVCLRNQDAEREEIELNLSFFSKFYTKLKRYINLRRYKL